MGAKCKRPLKQSLQLYPAKHGAHNKGSGREVPRPLTLKGRGTKPTHQLGPGFLPG